MKRTSTAFVLVGLVALGLTGCKKGSTTKYPGTEEGARQLLTELMKPGADSVKLTLELKPTTADYEAVFATKEMAQKAEAGYGKLWDVISRDPIKPKEGQTELKLWKATTEELKEGKGDAPNFPGGYARAAAHLKPGLTIYRWKFVRPGETLGMAYDGLVFVNGHWVVMPKPWRVVGR